MSNPVKPAVQYVTKGKRRRQANKAIVQSHTALEDSGAVAVEQSPWKRSRRQGLEKAIAGVGEGLPQRVHNLAGFFTGFSGPPRFFLVRFFFCTYKKKRLICVLVYLRVGTFRECPRDMSLHGVSAKLEWKKARMEKRGGGGG